MPPEFSNAERALGNVRLAFPACRRCGNMVETPAAESRFGRNRLRMTIRENSPTETPRISFDDNTAAPFKRTEMHSVKKHSVNK
jgi:hypothetical protein